MKKKKSDFDFSNFDFSQKLPEEKNLWWKFPLYVVGFILFKIVIIAPFVAAFLYFGEGWLGIGVGWLAFFVSSAVLYYFFEKLDYKRLFNRLKK